MNNKPMLFINSYCEVKESDNKSIYISNKHFIDLDDLVIGNNYTFEITSKELLKGKLIKIKQDSYILLNDNTSITINKNNVNKVYNY